MTTSRARRWIIALLAAGFVATAGGAALLPAKAATDTSAMTKKVTSGPFSGVSVTVAKTKNLVNEVVEVTWSGATPTDTGARRNFFQIMQCWGDDPAGPRPEQCQFGATSAVQSIGLAVNSRKVRGPDEKPGLPQDPAETHPLGADSKFGFVPFETPDGHKVDGDRGTRELFDQTTTNELPVARTRGDGRGQEFFEIQTAVEAPGLGCGKAVGTGSAKHARSCWLVVVPRNDVEVDGTPRTDTAVEPTDRALQTSPLSASNWKNRIEFPLSFQLVGGDCRTDVAPVQVSGDEFATEAITRWQPALCSVAGSVFSYTQIPDDVVRGGFAGTDPSLGILGRAPAAAPATGKPVYAPISVSGFGFAYNLEVRTLPDDPVAVQQRAGERITDLKLTPRLVAKLLTQSYRYGTTVDTVLDPRNPYRMEDDPEFKALNPQLAGVNKIASNSLWSVVTPLNPADAYALVWQWITADAEARDFLAGKPDPNGMVINPAWKDADLSVSSFPKLDQTCRPATATDGPLCVPDAFAYANDMHEAVLAASRGDTLARNSWDNAAIPPLYKKGAAQQRGTRGIIVAADTATAARYSLPMAKLRNANGQFVAPDPANLLAAVKAFKPSSTPGVLTPDPNVKVDNAYPLTVVSYAATVPAALTAKQRAAYAGFLRYAYGAGQKPGVAVGSLPAGYAPLPASLTAAAKAAANAIATYKVVTPTPTPKAAGSGGTSGSSGGRTGGSGGGSGSGGTTDDGGGATGGGAGPTPAAGETATSGPTPAETPAAGADLPTITPAPATTPTYVPTATGITTPPVGVGQARLALVWLLIAGLLALAVGRWFPRLRAVGAAIQSPGQPTRSLPDASTKPGGDAGA